MFYDEPDKKHPHHGDKDPSLDLIGLVFIGALIAIPLFLYVVAQ